MGDNFIYGISCIVCYGGDCLVRRVLLGKKVLRFCFAKDRKVVCDGLCRVTSSVASDVQLCPVEVEAFDLAVNC